MEQLHIEGITHWSIPVNNLDESEKFYGGLLGLKNVGRLGNSRMSCFKVDNQSLLLCERGENVDKSFSEEPNVHYSFTVSPDNLSRACKLFAEKSVKVEKLYYRKVGYFPGRELYFRDPSGNRLELRDPTWTDGMPEPSYEDVLAS